MVTATRVIDSLFCDIKSLSSSSSSSSSSSCDEGLLVCPVSCGEVVLLEQELACLDLSGVLSLLLERYYAEDWRYKFPPLAMLRLLLYKEIKVVRFLTTLLEDLYAGRIDGEALGFEKAEDGEGETSLVLPSYKTVWHFINVRLGCEGVRELFKAFRRAVKEKLSSGEENVPYGERLVVDASPIQLPRSDGEAAYNGHYKVYGDFWHKRRPLPGYRSSCRV